MKLIKIGIRNNLLYPLLSIIFFFSREVNSIVMSKLTGFDDFFIFTFLMFLSEFISGIIIYSYQMCFLHGNRRKPKPKYKNIELIEGENDIIISDSIPKIYLLIFMATFFDFTSFVSLTLYLQKYKSISSSLKIHLRSTLPLFSALLCHFILKIPFYYHQKCSLLTILIPLLIVLISGFIFESDKTEYILFLLINLTKNMFDSLLEIIEKYLMDIYLNEFKILMIEGIFGILLTLSITFFRDPFREIQKYAKSDSTFILLIILLFFHFFLSGGRNVYRISTNKLYFPVTRSLTDLFLDPLFIIYYLCFQDGFLITINNIFYLLFNLVISIIIVFCICIYNGFLVLYCCKLEHETYSEVSKRATIIGRKLENIIDDNEDDLESETD